MRDWRDWAAGAGMGGLTGLLVGLSVNSVAGGILTAIAALLAAVLGLRGDAGTGKPMRMFGFGLACILFLLAGIFIRGNNLLSQSVAERVAAWSDAGYDPETARAYAAWQILGAKPDSVGEIATPVSDARASVLFAGDAESCRTLDPAGKTVSGWTGLARAEGADWALALAFVQNSADRQAAIEAAWSAMCDGV